MSGPDVAHGTTSSTHAVAHRSRSNFSSTPCMISSALHTQVTQVALSDALPLCCLELLLVSHVSQTEGAPMIVAGTV